MKRVRLGSYRGFVIAVKDDNYMVINKDNEVVYECGNVRECLENIISDEVIELKTEKKVLEKLDARMRKPRYEKLIAKIDAKLENLRDEFAFLDGIIASRFMHKIPQSLGMQKIQRSLF